MLLGDELRFTRAGAIKAAEVPEEFAERLWRALGFPQVPDDTVAFTESDVAALVMTARLCGTAILDEDIVLRMARAVGQTTARLAKWQIDIIFGALTDPFEAPDPQAIQLILDNAGSHLGDLEPLLVHAWRRQIAAAGTRALVTLTSEESAPARTRSAVGFADLVAFTRTSRELDERELAQMVERFEETASDVIAEHGGRLVKTLGDEVLFTTDTARLCAEIGLSVAEAVRDDPEIPDVRVGMAYGPVLPLMGDVFGTTVNMAARLTSMARPGTALVDADLAAELRGQAGFEDAYELHHIARRRAHGLGTVQPYVLRRA
jgi:adenylate cyclase